MNVSEHSKEVLRLSQIGKIFSTLIMFLLASQFTAGQNLSSAENSIDSIIKKRMDESGTVGVGAAVIINKKVVWIKGFGYADKDNKVPFTPDTIMNIGSISKTLTGVCLMRAVEDKKLSLDEDVNKYLPFKVVNPYFPNEKITLRSLATHTSGISDRYPFYTDQYHYGDAPESLGEFLKNYFVPDGKYYSKDNFLNKKPGQVYDYSNIAAGLAGYIVELATGKKLNKYSKQQIFKPLKMQNTGWFLSEIDLAKHSKLYRKEGSATKIIPLYGLPTYPDGGVRTTVSDLSKFFISLLNEGEFYKARILEKKTVEEMIKLQFTLSSKPENIEINEKNSGIFWQTKRNVTQIGHGGTDRGVHTEMLSDLSKNVAVIVFANTTIINDSGETDYKAFSSISNDLWKFARELKNAETRSEQE